VSWPKRPDSHQRVSGIPGAVHYPAESPAWAPKTFAFSATGPAQFGLPANHWQHTTTHGNYRKVVHYDGYWRPVVTREWDAANPAETTRTTVRRFDALGREKFVSFPMATLTLSWNDPSLDKGTHSTFDALGRLRRSEQRLSDYAFESLITQINYLDGFRKQIVNPRQAITTWSFQAFDQPDEGAPTEIEHPELVRTRIERDIYGKPESITRSGTYAGIATSATRYFVYDVHQRLCKQIDPESGASVFGYDAANNQIWSAEARWPTPTGTARSSPGPITRPTVKRRTAPSTGPATPAMSPTAILAWSTCSSGTTIRW
jgi:hypothetical protein